MAQDLLQGIKLILDITLTLVAIPAAIMAVLQLIEMKKQRMADMAWRLFEAYSSREMAESRHTLYLVGNSFKNSEEYRAKYHDQPDDSETKQQDKKIRERVRFFHQAGLLVSKGLVDIDLLFGLIGSGFAYDYDKLRIIVQSSRDSDDDPNMYRYFDFLWAQYIKWEVYNRRLMKMRF